MGREVTQSFDLKRGVQKDNRLDAPDSSAQDFEFKDIIQSSDLDLIRDASFWDYVGTIIPQHFNWGERLSTDDVLSHKLVRFFICKILKGNG